MSTHSRKAVSPRWRVSFRGFARFARVGVAGVLAAVFHLTAVASAAAARPTATGTWIGTLDFGGSLRPITLQLHERESGEVLGYVLGGTGSRTIVDGHRRGRQLELTIELRDPVQTTELTVSGRLRGDTLDGVADDGATSQPVLFHRTHEVLEERRLLFAQDHPSSQGSVVQVSAVLDSHGRFVSGGFVGEHDCRPWACSGGLMSFAEAGTSLVIGLETDGGCSAGSSVDLTFDGSSRLYSGTYSFTDCEGTTTGSVFAGRTTRTRSDDVAQILQALGRLADGFSGHADFGSTHPSFSPSYRHYGRSLGDVLAGFNEERATYRAIDATFNRIQFVNTVEDPDTFPQVRQPLGAFFDEVRNGRTRRGGGRVTYLDTHARPDDRPLGTWSKEGSRWVISGNQVDALALPFDYVPGPSALVAPTPGGPVYVSVGPFGAHFAPLTGHAWGDPKGNLVGFFTERRSDLTELVGDMDGLCEPDERCGLYGGPDGDLIRDRVPPYEAPLDGTVSTVTYTPPNGDYLDNAPKWQMRIRLYTGHWLELQHVGRIAPSLRDAILIAIGIDTDTYTGPPGDLPGVAGIPVSAGEVLAFPQIMATEVTGHPGYFAADPDGIRAPFVQMEFALFENLPGIGDKVCLYAHLPRSTQHTLQGVLDAEMADPASPLFVLSPRRWEWSAEGRLCMAYSPLPEDFSGLFTSLGGWFKVQGPGSSPDELVSFAPIATDVAGYDASLYEPATSMLVTRAKAFGGPFVWDLPGSGPTTAFYPSGEILEDTGAALLVKWRTTGLADIEAYQRAAYLLDRNGLKIAWGPFASTPADAILPALGAGTPCDETSVLCYDHTKRDGF